MDKNTLSQYGWVVIVIIVLVIMITLATPFGNFISDSAMSVLSGFGMASEIVINKNVQPHGFPELPYKIVQNGNSYALRTPLSASKNIDSLKQLYVNSETGDDSNNGLTEATAYKTLGKALNTYKFGSDACCINILNNATFYEDELVGELAVKKNLAIRCTASEAKIVNGIKVDSWSSEDDTIYSTNTAGNIVGCVDISSLNLDDKGLYKPMTKCTSLTACQATDNSYYIDNTNNLVYVNPQSSVNSIAPIVNTYRFRFAHTTAPDSNYLYTENLNVVGGWYTVAKSAAYPQEGKTFELFAVNCTYQHDFSGDAAPHGNYDIVYDVECKAGYSKGDLFNTHNSVSEEEAHNAVLVFMDCYAEEAGYYGTGTGINNLYTAHDGENVLRINCSGRNADGPLFADANGCRSVLINCSSINAADKYATTSATASWHFNNTNASAPGYVTLINCSIRDDRNILRIDCECDMEYKNTDIKSNVDITGETTAL